MSESANSQPETSSSNDEKVGGRKNDSSDIVATSEFKMESEQEHSIASSSHNSVPEKSEKVQKDQNNTFAENAERVEKSEEKLCPPVLETPNSSVTSKLRNCKDSHVSVQFLKILLNI